MTLFASLLRERRPGQPPLERALAPAWQAAAPLSTLGYWIATALGFTWGFFWSGGKVVKRHGLWVFRGMPNWTFGRGGTCVGGCYFTHKNTAPATLRHEAVHREQWRKYGLAMPFLYWAAGANPHTNRFEIEAGLTDGGYR